MPFLLQPSLVGLLLQAFGALLIGTLCLVLLRTVHHEPLVYWATGWFALFVALAALFLSFHFGTLHQAGQSTYLLGEYVFGYLVIAGCRLYVMGRRPPREEAWLIVPALMLALWLPTVGGGDFNVFFTVHTLLYAYLFFAAYRLMRRARPSARSLPGVRVMMIALLLLTIDYLHYAPLFAASTYRVLALRLPYLTYAPLYDLLFQVMLMFGMVMLATGDVQHQLEVAYARLGQARDRVEAQAQLDHLTSALNRHAFYSMVRNPRSGERAVLSGCVAIADIDGLKIVNDRHGHAAGDAAIRAVATAIRSCIRADDVLFRWGGDEFLILLLGVTEREARARLESLNARLHRTIIAGLDDPIDLSASVGFASTDTTHTLDEVIARADQAMYAQKRQTATEDRRLRLVE